VHRLAPNIFCCAAGTSADAEQLTRSTALDLWLLREEAELATPFGHELPISSVSTALWHLQLRLAQSSAQCHIVLGGMDACGPSL
jgi:20S proteasome alpha/beta subunit